MESPLKNNPDQQAASVQLPWLEQQQRDREALAAETDQAPPPESKDRQWKVCEKHNAIFKRYACPLCKKELDAAIMPTIQDSTPQEPADGGVKRYPKGTPIRFLKHLTEGPCEDHPGIIYAGKGQLGTIAKDEGTREGYWVKTDDWDTPFGAKLGEEFEVIKPTAPAVAEQELLPCPFCGTPPISRWVGVSVPGMEDCGYHAVECPKCVGSGGVPFCGVHADLREDAEKQWNRRPAGPVAVGRRECKCTLRERESGHRVDCEQKGAEA